MPAHRKTAQHLALALTLLVACALASPTTARAQGAEVAILPMTTATKALRLYRNAAPSALAAQLAGTGLSIRVVTSTGDVPKTARVLIDGRLIGKGKGRLRIEVQVRRGSTGRPIATVASSVASATDIDRLVGELAGKLGPVLKKALTADPIVLPTTVVRGSALPRQRDSAAPIPPVASEPGILLLPATGEAAGGMVDVREPATQAAAHMLHRVGLTAGHSSQKGGQAAVGAVVAEMRSRNIPHALMVQVISVNYDYAGVLSARGRVRIVLVSQEGLPLLDKTFGTDTVVGGRGDRHPALVYRVVEQAFDIAQPSLSRALSGESKAPGAGT